jgi:hypothetical protein
MEWKRCPCGCPIQSSDGRFTGCPNGGKALAPADPTAGGTILGEPSATSIMPCERCGHMRQQHGGRDVGTGGACQQVDCACPGFVAGGEIVPGTPEVMPVPGARRAVRWSLDEWMAFTQNLTAVNNAKMARGMRKCAELRASAPPSFNHRLEPVPGLTGEYVPEGTIPQVYAAMAEEED